MALFLVFFSSCQRFEPESILVFTTDSIEPLAGLQYRLSGTIVNIGENEVTQHGFCWAETDNPTTSGESTNLGKKNSEGSFTSVISDLPSNTKYYVRAYIITSAGTEYGKVRTFTTTGPGLPVVTTTPVTGVTEYTAQSGGTITSDGGASIIAKGVCWSTSQLPTVSDPKTADGTGTGAFTSEITGLDCSTTYYVRAYATNSAGTAYGDQEDFTTSQCPAGLPTVTTASTGAVTETTAESGGNVTDGGSTPVTARGVCWSTSQYPTTSDPKTNDGNGTGAFTSEITGLDCNTTYYVRAYATNSAGTAYGDQEQFTTSQCPAGLPTVTTASTGTVTATTAESGGTVTDDGGAPVTARGVCWSTSQYPTTSDPKTNDGTGTGTFTSEITGLDCNITYYVRAYATNSAGTDYGDQEQFTTSPCPADKPTVTTASTGTVTATTAESGGTVTDDGGAPVTARGVCWSTSPNPTISDPKTNDGNGTGTFSSSITGLSPYVTYYVRAYATNSADTGYGEEQVFKTFWDNSAVTDIDGNSYSTAQISQQVWMLENLKVTRYNDGQDIPNVTSAGSWAALTTPGYCWYNNNEATYKNPYGALYNWYAASEEKLCPSGWHVSTDSEWTNLTNNLGGESVAGGKLKEEGTSHWIPPNTEATNEVGFTALPGGACNFNGEFVVLGSDGYYWTSDQSDASNGWVRYLLTNTESLGRGPSNKRDGYSIRCVKD